MTMGSDIDDFVSEVKKIPQDDKDLRFGMTLFELQTMKKLIETKETGYKQLLEAKEVALREKDLLIAAKDETIAKLNAKGSSIDTKEVGTSQRVNVTGNHISANSETSGGQLNQAQTFVDPLTQETIRFPLMLSNGQLIGLQTAAQLLLSSDNAAFDAGKVRCPVTDDIVSIIYSPALIRLFAAVGLDTAPPLYFEFNNADSDRASGDRARGIRPEFKWRQYPPHVQAILVMESVKLLRRCLGGAPDGDGGDGGGGGVVPLHVCIDVSDVHQVRISVARDGAGALRRTAQGTPLLRFRQVRIDNPARQRQVRFATTTDYNPFE